MVDGLLAAIFALRVSIVVGVLTVVVLIVPDQVREIHRILTLERIGDFSNFFNKDWLLCLASLLALSVVLWQTSRQHAEDYVNAEPDDAPVHSLTHSLLAWGPRVIATLPLLAAAVGIWLSRVSTVDTSELDDNQVPAELKIILAQQGHLVRDFAIGAGLCVALAVLLFVAATLFERKLAPVGSRRVRRVAILSNWLLFPLFILGSIVLLSYNPVLLPQWLGSIPIFALWMANISVLLALIWRYSRVVGFPILAVVVLLLVVFETAGWNDNHKFRYTVPTADIERPSVAEAFRTWLATRGDMDDYKAANKPYPLYVVAAEGGGLYAAYQTAKLLGHMQDLCSNFAQHVFVVSAVSGGSLGSAVFSGLAKESATNERAKPCAKASVPRGPSFESAADRILSRDLLSPVIWATLYPDFLQRFIPLPIQKLDRGYALELAFEYAWEAHAGEKKNNPLSSSFFGLCGADATACPKGAAPALALNVTNVETGMQMVLSQMELNTWPFEDVPRPYDIFAQQVPARDLLLSTAVGLSARFPWISPQGWYTFFDTPPPEKHQKPGDRRMSFVDGGYVDNSGVATATKLIRLLNYTIKNDTTLPAVDIKMIVISAAWNPFDRFWIDPPRNNSLSEYVSPFAAALSAWQGRGFTEQKDISDDRGYKVIDMGVYYNFMPLTVGWHLSGLSRRYINLFRGDPDKCDRNKTALPSDNHATVAGAYIYRAHCAAAEIVGDLTPR